MVFAYVLIIIILALISFLLALALYFFIRKNIYISDKEKEFIVFVINMYIKHFGDLELTSKEQHTKLIEELEKIKNKHFKI
jgi:competence protein ComGC